MRSFATFCIVTLTLMICWSCSARLNPREFELPQIQSPAIRHANPVSIRAKLVGSKEKSLPVAGGEIAVNEDEFTEVLVKNLSNALTQRNVPVVAVADRSIEVQVVKVSLQPDATLYCVIDFNRKLGNGEFYGFQSRSKNWNFETACEEALKNSVSDILNDRDTLNYLAGD